MNILALDSSTKNFSVAVASTEKILASSEFKTDKVLSDSIIPVIDSVLKRSRLELKDIDGFAVGLGPGSFTGLRIGLATVKGFVLAARKPVVGIPSPDILARNAWTLCSPGDKIAVISDAKRNMIYGCVYEKTKNGLKRKSRYLLTVVEGFLNILKGKIFFLGDGILVYRERILEWGSSVPGFDPVFCEENMWTPRAGELAALALPRFIHRRTDKVEKLNPLYLYPETCQIRDHLRSSAPAGGRICDHLR